MNPPERPRRSTRPTRPPRGPHPIGTPRGLSSNTGPIASAAWLAMRELYPDGPSWSVEIAIALDGEQADLVLDERTTCFHLQIYAEEWGYLFCHDRRLSWIRITDVPFVHGRDEHELLPTTPPLKQIGEMLYILERRHGFRFDRKSAAMRTTLYDAEPTIRDWLESL